MKCQSFLLIWILENEAEKTMNWTSLGEKQVDTSQPNPGEEPVAGDRTNICPSVEALDSVDLQGQISKQLVPTRELLTP